MSKTHELKTWPRPFQAMWDGIKFHELRKNDRDFMIGDTLMLKEYNILSKEYTGREIMAWVRYITPGGAFGLPDDLCIMSIQEIGRKGEEDS